MHGKKIFRGYCQLVDDLLIRQLVGKHQQIIIVCDVENAQTYPLFFVSAHRAGNVIDRAWYILQALYITMMFGFDKPCSKYNSQDLIYFS